MIRLFAIACLLYVLPSCMETETSNTVNKELEKSEKKITDTLRNNKLTAQIQLKDTVFYLKRNTDSFEVKIRVPQERKGILLILHGWNLPSDELCEKTDLCSAFLNEGYIIIQPDFGKTTYQWENYPETKKSYLKFPSRHWIQDTFIVVLQRDFGLLMQGGRNFVYGVSTGGRGAALLALENPDIFKAAACLSADFDHDALGDEPINTGYYGSRKQFPDRWKGRDNIHNRAAEFKPALFLGHGSKDKICPEIQTINFSKKLMETNPELPVKTVIDAAGNHTYIWWNKQTMPILEFFNGF